MASYGWQLYRNHLRLRCSPLLWGEVAEATPCALAQLPFEKRNALTVLRTSYLVLKIYTSYLKISTRKAVLPAPGKP